MRLLLLFFLILPLYAKHIQRDSIAGLTGSKKVVLTFDDGPNDEDSTTYRLLEVLKKHDVKAYFCLIGSEIEREPDITKAIAAAGHPIGWHTMGDSSVYEYDSIQCSDDLMLYQKALNNALGYEYNIEYCRPPYGLYTSGFEKVAKRDSMEILMVTRYYSDAPASQRQADKIVLKSIKCMKRFEGGMLVFHDGKNIWTELWRKSLKKTGHLFSRRWVVDAVDALITELKAEGYEFMLLKDVQ